MPELRHLRRDSERGATLATIAILLVALLGMAAFALDVGQLYWVRADLQTTADAASLAAAQDLPDAATAQTTAITYADLNYNGPGSVLGAGNVLTGFWNASTRTFTPGATPVNAVKVTTKRTQAQGNAVDHFFAPVLGFQESDVAATAIALKAVTHLDFEEGVSPGDQPNQISWGSGISGDEMSGWVTIGGPGFGPMVFDATCGGIGPPNCSGGDNDLWQPTQGNCLIISEDGDSTDPDDEAAGGIITFDFSNFGTGLVTVSSLVLIDAEEGGLATLYRDGEVIGQTVLGGVLDGEMEVRFIDPVAGVDYMTIELFGSGAVDDIGSSQVIRLVG